MKVVPINGGQEASQEERKKIVLGVIDELREQIENDEITEFVTCYARTDGGMGIHVACFDVLVALGMFTLGQSKILDDFNYGPDE